MTVRTGGKDRRAMKLINGIELPHIGFGTYKTGANCVDAVREAVACGYRLIDTASVYGNEREVGEAVATCGTPREELLLRVQMAARCYREGLAPLVIPCGGQTPGTPVAQPSSVMKNP